MGAAPPVVPVSVPVSTEVLNANRDCYFSGAYPPCPLVRRAVAEGLRLRGVDVLTA